MSPHDLGTVNSRCYDVYRPFGFRASISQVFIIYQDGGKRRDQDVNSTEKTSLRAGLR